MNCRLMQDHPTGRVKQKWAEDRHLQKEKSPPRVKEAPSENRNPRQQLRSAWIQQTNKFRHGPISFPSGDADSIFPVTQIRIGWKPSATFGPKRDIEL